MLFLPDLSLQALKAPTNNPDRHHSRPLDSPLSCSSSFSDCLCMSPGTCQKTRKKINMQQNDKEERSRLRGGSNIAIVPSDSGEEIQMMPMGAEDCLAFTGLMDLLPRNRLRRRWKKNLVYLFNAAIKDFDVAVQVIAAF
ncbi:hypothetical protein LXL04_029259 [Taraxacum kok-saghyz]